MFHSRVRPFRIFSPPFDPVVTRCVQSTAGRHHQTMEHVKLTSSTNSRMSPFHYTTLSFLFLSRE